jgi:hypothetical protein
MIGIGLGLALAGGAGLLGSAMGADASRSAANTQADAAKQASQTQLQMFNQTQANLQPYMGAGNLALSDLMGLMGITPGTPGTPAVPGTPAASAPGTAAPVAMGGAFQQSQQPGTGPGGSGPLSWLVHARPGATPTAGATGGTPGAQGTPAVPGTPASFNPNAPLLKPFGLSDFQQSPAYQFNLQEGQKAIDKAAAARGNYYAPQTLQDISKFSQGLASDEFQNAFSNYNTNQNNVFSRLNQLTAGGQNAAANLGGISAGVGQSVGGNTIGAGNALAAGQIGQANAISGGLSGLGNNALLYALLNNQGGGGLGGQQGIYSPNVYGGNSGPLQG